jgi:hypothetical protein
MMPPTIKDEPISIVLTPTEWNTVIAALIEAPYRIAAPLVQKIGEQARAQRITPPLHPANGDGAERHAPD